MAKKRTIKKGLKPTKGAKPTQPDSRKDKIKSIQEKAQTGGSTQKPTSGEVKSKKIGPPINKPKFAPNDIENVFNAVMQIVQGDKNAHAFCVISDPQFENVIRLSVDENAKEQDVLNLRDTIMGMTGITANEIVVTRCKPLRLFAPYPVCAKYGEVSGSCGPFFDDTKGKRYVFSCAHVLPDKGNELHVANLFHMQSDQAVVEFKDRNPDGFDVGFARLNPPTVSWQLQPTTIAKAVVNECVSHFGSASVEESEGRVISTKAYAKITDGTGAVVYKSDKVILLDIDSRYGDSGSPVVNDSNRVIGLIIGGDASNREIFCVDLKKFEEEGWPDKYAAAQIYLNTDGSFTRKRPNIRWNRRREIELQLHHGTIIRDAGSGTFGEIISDQGVSVLTHLDHSFDDMVTSSAEVWFFAVPLEYVVTPEDMAGVGNASPLLAINISKSRPHLDPLSGLHKRTPCGTGTTI